MSKYGTPWSVRTTTHYEGDYTKITTVSVVDSRGVHTLPCVEVGSLHDAEKEVCARIVACVNACAGIENPGALPALLARIEHALADDPNGRLAGIRGAFDVMMGDRT